jgi:hypothetical protein
MLTMAQERKRDHKRAEIMAVLGDAYRIGAASADMLEAVLRVEPYARPARALMVGLRGLRMAERLITQQRAAMRKTVT